MPLWQEFTHAMSFDNIILFQNDDLAFKKTLKTITHYLLLSSRKMQDFGLPISHFQTREVTDEIIDLQSNHDLFVEEAEQRQAHLTEKQLLAYHDIMHTIQTNNPLHTMLFVEGCPGRGKTYLIQKILAVLHADFQIVLVVGSSALSAIAYHRGRTAHYMFSIPVTDDNVDLHSKVPLRSAHADLIHDALAIIWNELPIVNKAAWECVNLLCCHVMQHFNLPFGGNSLAVVTFIKVHLSSLDLGKWLPLQPQ